jgi:hypothetical protein
MGYAQKESSVLENAKAACFFLTNRMHSCGTPIFLTKILTQGGGEGGELDCTACVLGIKKFDHTWRKMVKIEAFLCNVEVVYYAGVEGSENINKK